MFVQTPKIWFSKAYKKKYLVIDIINIMTMCHLISLRLGFRRNFLSVLHPNLVSSPIKGILEILNLTTRCIPMDILA